MARALIGLDIGTAAVRAAEVRLGRGRPTLVRFGQVALPAGAVIAGEVVDPTAVSVALRRLWKDVGFTGKRVVTGVAGSRVVARTTDLPAMDDDEIRSSLPFQVQELIPIPLDEAVLDHQVLEHITGADGEERVRVLVVAAHRDVLRSLLAALDGAGLEAERVDLIPTALIRAVAPDDYSDLHDADDTGDDGTTFADAIVDVGGGVTNVVVHEHGMPRFIRTIPTGGLELTEAIVTGLDVPFDEAEALKRGSGVDVEVRYARDMVLTALAPVVEEIRTSLDYWQAQAPDVHLRRVVVTGGGAATDDVLPRLELALAVPVERAHAFTGFEVAKSGLDEHALLAAETVGSVALGLALGDSSIDLLPGDVAELRRARRRVILAGAGVVVFALALMGVHSMRSGEVDDANAQATAAETRTATLTQQIAALSDVETLEADLATRRQTVQSILEGDVAWVSLIQRVSASLPEDVWLTNLSGTRGTALDAGDLTVGAMGRDQTSTARWIQKISDLDALTGVWVPASTKTEAGGQELVQFSSNATLTPAATSHRAEAFAEGAR
jgi:type IV pilus assembly protein PilM